MSLNDKKPVTNDKNVRKHEVAQKLGTKSKTSKSQTNLACKGPIKHAGTKVRINQTYIETDIGSGCNISKQTEKNPNQTNQTSIVNKTNGLKSNVRQSEGTKMAMQQQTNQCKTNAILNDRSFSHKLEKNVKEPKLQQELDSKDKKTDTARTDPESGCCTSNQTEKQSDCFTVKDVSDFDNMNVKQPKMYVQERGVPALSYDKAQLIILAKAVFEMDLPVDPNFENDSLTPHLERQTTLPNGTKVPDPFQMTGLTNDLSSLPPFGLVDIFNHLIMSRADYDKEALSSWRSFEEYSLFLDGYVICH